MESKKKLSAGIGFAAGALLGAIAVFVPLASAGHPRSSAERLGQRVPSSVEAPAAGEARKAGTAGPATPAKQDTRKPPRATNETACDVQLD